MAIKLKPGDLLLIDNRRVLHSRNAFQAHYDGYDRWLQRIYLLADNLSWRWREKLETKKYHVINDLLLQ